MSAWVLDSKLLACFSYVSFSFIVHVAGVSYEYTLFITRDFQ